MLKHKITIAIVISLLASICLFSGELKKLTFEQAFANKGEKLYSPLPDIPGWYDDDHYLFVENNKLFKIHYKTGKQILILNPADHPDIEKNGFNLLKDEGHTDDYNRFIFLKDDDIFLFERQNKILSKITDTPGTEQNPVFSPDGNKIAYTRDGNLFIYDIVEKKTTQITNDGNSVILNGYCSWIYYEEVFGRASRYRAFWWSPDSKKIAFMRFDQSKMPIYDITIFKGDYNKIEKQYYPKPGYPNPDVKIGIADASDGNIQWVDFTDTNDHYLAFPVWNEDGTALFFQWMNRGQDHLKVLRCNNKGKEISVLYEERQKEWVEFLDSGTIIYSENGDIILISSLDGWYNLYHFQKDGKVFKLTSGEWLVRRIAAYDPLKKTVYFLASKEDSCNTGIYSVSLKNKKIVPVSAGAGTHGADFSPDNAKYIETSSSLDTPKSQVMKNSFGKAIRTLGSVDKSVADKYALGKYEFLRIPVSDGYKLPAIMLLPPDFSKDKKYPVLFNIYGGPSAPTVRNEFRQRLDPQFYAEHGIISLWVDHRGSGHFGKKAEALMFRKLGYWEIKDFSDTVTYLRTLPFIDGDKIGITGGSYGGYVAALAACTASGYFKFADADASVTDWHFYDSIYTERYMDTPEENPEGYKNGSVMNYVDGYKGGLRITHGTADDNVHMQNTIILIDTLEEKGKPFEFMLYPQERHGYRGLKRYQSNRDSLDFWFRSFFGKTYKNEDN